MNLSQDEINALLSGNSSGGDPVADSEIPAPIEFEVEPGADEKIDQSGIDALFAQMSGGDEPAPAGDEKIDQAGVDALFAQMSGGDEPAPAGDEKIDQAGVDALFAQMSGGDEPPPAGDEKIDQAGVDALFAQMSGANEPEPAGDEKIDQSGIDALFAQMGGSEEQELMSAVAASTPVLEKQEPGSGWVEDPVAPGGISQDAQKADARTLTTDEIDVIGEIGNICMGAVATTLYTLLDKRVSITTPKVSVHSTREVLAMYKIPFAVVRVEYVEGIIGSNLLVLKVADAALITDLLMGGEGLVEEPVELNELHLSAISEIMNQMMGASSTALSKLLRAPVNISPPMSANVGADGDIAGMLDGSDIVIKTSFDMEIEGLLKSELLQLIPFKLGLDLAEKFMQSGMGVPSSGTAAPDPAPAPAPTPAPTPAPAPTPQPTPQPTQPAPQPQPTPQPVSMMQEQPAAMGYPPPQGEMPGYPYPYQYPPGYPPQGYPPQGYPQGYPPGYPPAYPPAYPGYPQQPQPVQQAQPTPQAPLVDVHPMQFQSFDGTGSPDGAHRSMDLVYDIPLQVSVELGKTKKEISEILEFSTGTIVVLDKVAGDPVEIIVNGKLIARGEVVVIDENYGVRITEIISD